MTLEAMNRPPVPIPLVPDGESWRAELPADPGGARVLLLVNPHNPTGRCFTRTELEELAEYADRHDLAVISDEIHADLTFAPNEHIPFGLLRPDRTVTITSASKAFNMGGVHCADRPRRLRASPDGTGDPAAESVRQPRASSPWPPRTRRGGSATPGSTRVLTILDRNRKTGGRSGCPPAGPTGSRRRPIWPGSTPASPMPPTVLEREARVMVSTGTVYGAPDTWIRLNFGTSGPILDEILDRIRM